MVVITIQLSPNYMQYELGINKQLNAVAAFGQIVRSVKNKNFSLLPILCENVSEFPSVCLCECVCVPYAQFSQLLHYFLLHISTLRLPHFGHVHFGNKLWKNFTILHCCCCCCCCLVSGCMCNESLTRCRSSH